MTYSIKKKKYSIRNKHNRNEIDTAKNIAMQEQIISRADYSLAILGMAIARHGSGRFINIRPSIEDRL